MKRNNHFGFFRLWFRWVVMPFCMTLSLLVPMVLRGAEEGARKVVRIPAAHFNRLMIVDENNHPISGYAYDYIQMIGTYARWNIEYVQCDTFAECVNKLLSGEVDLFYDISYTEDRAQVILYPDEPMGNEYYYLYATDTNTSIVLGDYGTLNGKTVGVTSGTMQIELLKEWCKKRNVELTIVEYGSIPEKEADLFAGKIDLDLEVSMLAKRNLSAIEKIGSSAYYLVANKNRPDLIEDINSSLDKVLKNDLYYLARLEERYFSDTVLSHNLTVEEIQWIDAHKVLRVGYFDHYLPFSTKGQDGEPTGAGIDAIRDIVKALKLDGKVDVEFVCFNNQEEGYKAVESGEIDLMFPAYVSSSVQQDYRIMAGKIVASFASDLAYVDDAPGGTFKRIGVNRNNLMQYYYTKDSLPESEIVFYDNIRACLDGLLQESSDATFLNGFRSEALLKPTKYHPIRTVRATSDLTFRMAFAEDNIGLMLLMNRGLAMLEPDFVNKSLYAYVGNMYSYSIMDFLREHILVVIILVAVLAGLIMALVGDQIRTRDLAVVNRELKARSDTIEKQRLQELDLRKQLEEALQKAQAASRAKTAFLSNMSHDIRTPMNAIIGFTGLAASNINDTERVREYLATIEQSSEHLLSLINDVLDMSRIESGKMTLVEKAESLSGILHVLGDIVHADMEAKRHTFSIDTSDVRNDHVYCDKMRLNQVLLNLVSNAIKYTCPGGTISLRVNQKPADGEGLAAFEFRCKDNGIGMGEEFAKTIFDPFTREETSTVSGIQGTGLGMAITKHIVEMMGGTISVASKKGEGTEFVFSVVLRIAAGEETRDDRPDRAEQKVSLSGKRVLLVDDSDLNVKIGVLQFQRQGMVVDVAQNGRIAVDKIREKGADAYDFVLMDVQMPVMNGYEATAEIRKLPGGDRLTIIAYSANAFEEDREHSLKAGMNGHISKPLKMNDFLNELSRLVG